MGGCCAGGDKHLDKEFENVIVKDRWKMVKKLGKGSFGMVFEVCDINDPSVTYAMKIEYLRNVTGRLPQEAMVLERMAEFGTKKHIPAIFDKGRLDDNPDKPKQFIVMTLLGPDLAELRKLSPRKCFSPSTCALLMLQGIDGCKELHKAGIIHRDIKPSNYMTGLRQDKHKIYLIDFGLAKKFVDDEGRLLPPRYKAPFRGTPRYASTDTHKGIECGRHHDLWCLFHTVIELRKGELPWSIGDVNMQRLFEVKRKIIPSKWLGDVEPEYLLFYENLTSLRYEMEPDYERFTRIFERVLESLKLTPESPLDWEENGGNYNKLPTKKLKKMFRDVDASSRKKYFDLVSLVFGQ